MNAVRLFTTHVVNFVPRRCGSVNTYARAANEIFDRVREIRRKADSMEPPKLFVVETIAPVNGRPYWERNILEELGLSATKEDLKKRIRKKVGTYVTVKNTPQMCRMLWRVKHLVRIKPVTFPNGEPTPGEFTGTHLSRYGVFTKDSSLHVDPERLKVDSKFTRVQLEGLEIAKPSHLRWMNGI